MANLKSKQVAAGMPALNPDDASCPVAAVGEYVTTATLAAGDIIEMIALPANTVPSLVVLAAEDLDTNGTPTIALDVGVMSGDYGAAGTRTCGAEFFSSSTVAQAGGVEVSSLAAGGVLLPSASDRSIGVKLAAGAATLAAGKKIRLTAFCVPAPVGIDAA